MSRNYLIAGLFFAAALVVGLMLTYPAYQDMQAAQKNVADRQEEFSTETALVTEVQDLQSKYKSARDDIQKASDLLPTFGSRSLPDLMIELEKLATQSGVSLDSVTFTSPNDKAGNTQGGTMPSSVKTVITKLQIKGAYANIKYFVYSIEADEHLMDLTTISITPPAALSSSAKQGTSTAAADNLFTLATSLNVYYQ